MRESEPMSVTGMKSNSDAVEATPEAARQGATNSDAPNSETVPGTVFTQVWDAPTRLFHLGLVLAVTSAILSGFEDKLDLVPGTETDYGSVHLWSGTAVLMLLAFRALWGCIGGSTARFSRFPLSPVRTCVYMKTLFQRAPVAPAGHNPLGAWMVLVMLSLLSVQAALGLYSDDDILFTGPLRDTISDTLSDQLTAWHTTIGEGLPWLLGLHVFASLFYRVVKGRNIVWPMITGRGRVWAPGLTAVPLWRAVAAMTVAAIAVYALVFGL